jgi:hypothetical protein
VFVVDTGPLVATADQHEGRPMQEVARQAIREYVEAHSRADLLDRVLTEELPRYAEAMDRLGR